MKQILGISSTVFNNNFDIIRDYEINALIEEGNNLYDEVLLINPLEVEYYFGNGSGCPDIRYNDRSLKSLTSLLVRNTRMNESAIALLANTLHFCGCDLIDPIKRFSGAPAGKLLQLVKGFGELTIPETIVIFNKQQGNNIINNREAILQFPMIAKPENGCQGKNVKMVRNIDELKNYISDFYSEKTNETTIVLLQKYVEVKDEYRVILIEGKSLGLCKKISGNNGIAANAALGGVFVQDDDKEIIDFSVKHASKHGILGIDIIRDQTGRLYFLESNRSPQWKEFQKATGINVAKAIVEFAYERAKRANDLF
jgi:RimK family alpha-L-glutamate ligase